jgi:protein-S-isoprenylcysteine O-methyltransferase Ste14
VAFALYIGRFQITPEERILSAKFGAAYFDYKSRVRRWL